ncbi:MAG: hypothetical protein WCB11_03105 [Terriglobales bacterium]
MVARVFNYQTAVGTNGNGLWRIPLVGSIPLGSLPNGNPLAIGGKFLNSICSTLRNVDVTG